MKHRKIFALSSVLFLWMLSNGLILYQSRFRWVFLLWGFLLAIGLTIIGLLALLFLYNIYLACCSILKLENKLRPTIYDGIAFSSLVWSIIMAINRM